MDQQLIAELQSGIVRAVADNVADVMEGEWGDRAWVHLFVDFEHQPGGRNSSITFALARNPGAALEKVAFRLTPEAKQLFARLAEAMADADGRHWTTAQLRVERDGRFAFDVSYDPPRRLSGNHIDRRFDAYLEEWLATERKTPLQETALAEAKPWWRRLWRNHP